VGGLASVGAMGVGVPGVNNRQASSRQMTNNQTGKFALGRVLAAGGGGGSIFRIESKLQR
jgi:hypothetical protein